MSMRGGVLSPEDAKRLMQVLGEMTDYVDGEDLNSIAAQKPIYEPNDSSGGGGGPMYAPPDEAGQQRAEDAMRGVREEFGGGGGGDMEAAEEAAGMDLDGNGEVGESPGHAAKAKGAPMVMMEEKKVVGRPSRLDRRR